MITEIDFDNRTSEELQPETVESVRSALTEAMKGFEQDSGYQISVSFAGDEEIRDLNREYRNNDSVTDVLSFPMDDCDGRGVMLLGDIVINLNRAAEQAAEYGHSFEREITYLSVHSLLHLLGYDHEDEEDAAKMRSAEKDIMNRLKIYRQEQQEA